MVADDEEFCIASLKIMLTKAEISNDDVDFTIDGLECYQKVMQAYNSGTSYDLIITDFNMPKLNGLESTQKIRTFLGEELKIPIEKQPKIIGLTGHVAESYTRAGREAGMTEIYGKPLYYDVLEEILDKYYYN